VDTVCFCDLSALDLADFSVPDSVDFSVPDSVDFSVLDFVDFSVLESDALLASLLLAAGSLFEAAGLASEEVFDFEAVALPLFSLTSPFPLVVDFKP